MVRSTVEPEWDDVEQQWMLALAAYRSQELCSLCGMQKSICQDPQTEFRVHVDDPARCHVTTAIRRKQAERHSMYGTTGKHEDALLWSAGVSPG
jgi:hypothetical protein